MFLFLQGILPANDEERSVIHQLTSSIFDSFNLEDPVEQLCDELLEPPVTNLTDVLAGLVPPTAPPNEPPECPSPGNQRQAPCSESPHVVYLYILYYI